MSDQTDNVVNILKPFGLSKEESIIYLYLLENNISSALSISRRVHIARTKVYRLLDKLIEKQLVIQECQTNGFKFKAHSPDQLEYLINKKEIEISSLKQALPQTIGYLKNHLNQNNNQSQILYYSGQEGLSQVNWNILNAKNEFLSYEIDNAEAYLPKIEAEKLRQALVNKKIVNRMLSNQKNMTNMDNKYEFHQIRYISPKIVQIKTDIFIYNDILAICHYLDNHDIFCLEMKNINIVNMQKQIFENIWQQATPCK